MDPIMKNRIEKVTAETARKISSLKTKDVKKITDFFSSNMSHNFTEDNTEKEIKSLIKEGFLKETSSRYELTEKSKNLLK